MDTFLDIIGHSLQFIGWAFFPLLLLPLFVVLTGRGQNLTNGLIAVVESFMDVLGEIIKWVMPFMVISIVISIFALSIYGISAPWWDETAIYLHAIGICLGVAPTYLAGQHVRVDILFEKMTKKMQALIEFCGFYILLVPVCIAVIWRSQSFVSFAWQTLEGSSTGNGIKGIYILKTLLFAMALLLLIQGFSMALRAALKLRNKSQLSAPMRADICFLEAEHSSFKVAPAEKT